MLNKVFLMGRLVADPEMRHTQSGTPVATFRIAVDRDFKNKETGEKQADFITIIAWKSTAEFVSKYFSKGRMAVVDGRIQTRQYKDKEDNKRVAVEVVADSIYFGDSKREDGGGSPSSFGNQKPYYMDGSENNVPTASFDARTAYYSQTPGEPAPMTEITEEDGELPF